MPIEQQEPAGYYSSSFGTKRISFLAVCALLLLAFLLRAYNLGVQSLWYDEAFSIYLSRLDLASITARTAADIHPPLYYYLLHFWLQVAGSSEFAVRYLSLFFGVLTVPLLFKLADQLWGRRWPIAPHVIAWLASLSPVYVWYSQEARMYTLAVFLSASGLYWFAKIIGVGGSEPYRGRQAYILFILANVAAAYAHFYALFVLAAEAMYAFGLWGVQVYLSRRSNDSDSSFDWTAAEHGGQPSLPRGGQRRPPLRLDNRRLSVEEHEPGLPGTDGILESRSRGFSRSSSLASHSRVLLMAISFIAIVLAYVPWSGYAITRLSADTSYYQGTIDIWTILRETFILFAVGHTAEPSSAALAAIALATLAAAGFVAATYSARSKKIGASLGSLALVLLTLVMPIVLLYLISYNRPKFHPRYLLLASPAYFMLVSLCLAATLQGALNRGREQRWKNALPVSFFMCFIVVATFWIQSLANLYYGGQFARDDWRSAANYVLDNSREGDAVILISGHAFPAFTYYYSVDNWTPLPDGFTLSTENTLGYNIANTLNRVLKDKDRLWVVRWQAEVVDPNGYLDRLLDQGPQRLPIGSSFNGISIQLFAIPRGTVFSAEPKIPNNLEVNFDNKLTLLGYELRGDQSGQMTIASGGMIPLTLYWLANSSLDADYTVSLRVKDRDGHYWGRSDRRPANYFYPTQRWKPGEIVFGDYDVPLLAGTPPGVYTVEVEVYSRQGKGIASLNVLDYLGAPAGNTAALIDVQATKSKPFPTVSQLQIPKSRHATFGDVELLGYEEIAKGEPLQQGGKAQLMLFWRAQRQPTKDLDVVLQLAGTSNSVFYEKRLPLARKDYPTTEWGAGELIRAQYDLVVPPDAIAGEAQLRVVLADSTGLVGEPTVLQKVDITGRQRQMNPPTKIQHPQQASLGGVVTFLGYDLERDVVKPGGTVRLTLYWQASGRIERSLAVFTHLLDGQERMWGQKDSIPAGGASPTTGWVQGEVTTDVYDIPVKPDAPEGDMVVEIGMYDPATGERLLVDGRDNRILLGHLRVAR